MASPDLTLPLRQAIVEILKADPGLTSIVPPDSINGERAEAKPSFPFTRYGVTDSRQSSIDIPIHAFSKSDFTDEVAAMNAAIVECLSGRHGRTIALDGGRRVYLTWASSTVIPASAENGVWHGINRFSATAPSC